VYVGERRPITLGNAQTSHSLKVADKDKQAIGSETGAVNSSGFFGEQKDANQV